MFLTCWVGSVGGDDSSSLFVGTVRERSLDATVLSTWEAVAAFDFLPLAI